MLTTKEAIAARRSIRKFKPDSIPEEHLNELLEAARLAPSGSNAQPCRYKVVKDEETKAKIVRAANNQKFLASAPVVLVCCVDLKGYIDGSLATIQDMAAQGALSQEMTAAMTNRTRAMAESPREDLAQRIGLNIGIAAEHIYTVPH